jgi:hypothetical protein
MARFLKQQKIVAQIVAKFEEPGADSEATFAPGSPEDVAKKQRGQEVVELVGQVSAHQCVRVMCACADGLLPPR